jgi:branched-subunit amino acid ABC-type transport system permease component
MATYLAAFFGAWALVYATACVQSHLGGRTMHAAALALIVGLSICGTLNLLASWLLYRRHALALLVYSASWLVNIVGMVALLLGDRSRPVWIVIVFALALSWWAFVMIRSVRNGLAQRAIAA